MVGKEVSFIFSFLPRKGWCLMSEHDNQLYLDKTSVLYVSNLLLAALVLI